MCLSSLITGYLFACTLSDKSSPQCQASPEVLAPFYFLSPFCNNLFYFTFSPITYLRYFFILFLTVTYLPISNFRDSKHQMNIRIAPLLYIGHPKLTEGRAWAIILFFLTSPNPLLEPPFPRIS